MAQAAGTDAYWPFLGRFATEMKKNCIGVDLGQTQDATLAKTGGGLLPGIELPTCVVWKWRPQFGGGPESLQRCGGDRDDDGYDDRIDCAPDNPRVHPGAVDTPNDGIDQNCDGSDLVVGKGVVQVTLLWDNDNDNDMDLYVTEPGGTTLWYGSQGPTSTGGRLDRDDDVGVCGSDSEVGGVENVYWSDADATPRRGTSTVQVKEYDRCTMPAEIVVEVRIDGRLVEQRTATGSTTFTFTY